MVQQRAGGTRGRGDESTVHAVASKGVATPSAAQPFSALPFSASMQHSDDRTDRGIAPGGVAGSVPHDEGLVAVHAGDCPGRGRARRFELALVGGRERLAKPGGS
jgi:hypothetical protein